MPPQTHLARANGEISAVLEMWFLKFDHFLTISICELQMRQTKARAHIKHTSDTPDKRPNIQFVYVRIDIHKNWSSILVYSPHSRSETPPKTSTCVAAVLAALFLLLFSFEFSFIFVFAYLTRINHSNVCVRFDLNSYECAYECLVALLLMLNTECLSRCTITSS